MPDQNFRIDLLFAICSLKEPALLRKIEGQTTNDKRQYTKQNIRTLTIQRS